MSKVKIHLAVAYESKFGGSPVHISTTLCGRENRGFRSEDGNNSTVVHAEVSCAFCKKLLSNPRSWQYRKFLCQEARNG